VKSGFSSSAPADWQAPLL
jgi:hypothetical protein